MEQLYGCTPWTGGAASAVSESGQCLRLDSGARATTCGDGHRGPPMQESRQTGRSRIPGTSAGPLGGRGGRAPRQPSPGTHAVWPRGVCLLACLLAHHSGVRQALRRPVPRSSLSAAGAAAAHPCERSGEPVQTGLAKCGRKDGGQRCRAVHVPLKPEHRTSPPTPLSMDTGINSAVGWTNLTTRVSFGVPPRLFVLPFTLR